MTGPTARFWMIWLVERTQKPMNDQRSNVSARDPVCGMQVDPTRAAAQVEHEGTTYYFCNSRCAERFRSNPRQFIEPRTAAADPSGEYVCPICPGVESATPGACPKCGMALGPAMPARKAVRYTCPMHPEVVQDHPGACPKCGMALEPTMPIAEQTNPELADMSRRFWIGFALTVPLLALAMGHHVPVLGAVIDALLPGATFDWAQLLLATPVVLWPGWPLLERGGRSLRGWNLNMFTLIALGVIAAWGYSVVATLTPESFPETFRDAAGHIGVYFEAAAAIVVLVLLGQVLELRARERTGDALRALLDLAPQTARRIKADGSEQEITLDQVQHGDRLRVRPGDKVPVDGEVIEGRSAIGESMVTGEPMPESKGAGDKVVGGTINGTGSFVMRAERVGSETLLAQIVQMVAEAQRSRAPVQRLADVVAG
jgi:P-type Cu+ transporter